MSGSEAGRPRVHALPGTLFGLARPSLIAEVLARNANGAPVAGAEFTHPRADVVGAGGEIQGLLVFAFLDLHFRHVLHQLGITRLNAQGSFQQYRRLIEITGVLGTSRLFGKLLHGRVLQGEYLHPCAFLAGWRAYALLDFPVLHRRGIAARASGQDE
jgi:hypothetical protein